jgi:ABC-type uncharacterized transport system substrate-binding protein
MRRRDVLSSLGASLLLLPAVANSQDAGRTYRLGAVAGASRDAARIKAFFDELKLLGFVEGQNLIVIDGGFGLRNEQFVDYATKMVKSSPDVIVSVSDAAIRASRSATQTIPIVGSSPDLLAAGFVRSLSHPGGNVTGVSLLAELDGKRQELLMDAIPTARRIALLADPGSTSPDQLKTLEDAIRARGVDVVVVRAATKAEIEPALDQAKALEAEALNVLSTPTFSVNRGILLEKVASLRLPAIYEWPEMAEEGGLIAYGPSLALIYRQTARLVAKIFRGAKVEDLPVQLPASFSLVVNIKTMKALGINLPEAFMARADALIE